MIASFELANCQCFNSTFINLKIASLVLNAKWCDIVVFTQCSRQWLHCSKQNIVYLFTYIYMLTSSEEISKIEKTYLKRNGRTSQSFTKSSSFPINSSIFRKHVRQMPRGRCGMVMPSPWAAKNCEWPNPGTDNVSKCPAVAGGGGVDSAGIDWWIIGNNFTCLLSTFI